MMHTKFNIVNKIGFKLIFFLLQCQKPNHYRMVSWLCPALCPALFFPGPLQVGRMCIFPWPLTRGQDGVLRLNIKTIGFAGKIIIFCQGGFLRQKNCGTFKHVVNFRSQIFLYPKLLSNDDGTFSYYNFSVVWRLYI